MAKFGEKQKIFGVTLVAVTPILVGIWILSRPPATPASAAEEIVSALESGDGKRLYGFLLPEEQNALGLSQSQSERILTDVLAPAYRKLNVKMREKQFLSGSYEKFFRVPCRPNGTDATFTIALFELSPRNFQTSISYIYLGIQNAELEAAKKDGKSKQAWILQQDRVAELKKLGLNGLYNFKMNLVEKWPSYYTR